MLIYTPSGHCMNCGEDFGRHAPGHGLPCGRTFVLNPDGLMAELHTEPEREETDVTTCSKCSAGIDPLEVFPGPLCLSCYAASPDGRRMPTADELTAMWGGPVRH